MVFYTSFQLRETADKWGEFRKSGPLKDAGEAFGFLVVQIIPEALLLDHAFVVDESRVARRHRRFHRQ